MHHIQTNSMATRLDHIDVKTLILCKICISGKHHEEKFPLEEGTRAIELLGLIHIDIYGTLQIVTQSG